MQHAQTYTAHYVQRAPLHLQRKQILHHVLVARTVCDELADVRALPD
jgi:hypothetical protein